MQPTEWPLGFTLILIAVAVISYLAALLLHSRKSAALKTHLEMAIQAAQNSESLRIEVQTQLKGLEKSNRDLELNESRQQQRLQASEEKLGEMTLRLHAMQEEAKTARQQLDAAYQQYHETAQKKEAAAAELRALTQNHGELKHQYQEQLDLYNALMIRQQNMSADHAKLQTALEAREEHFKQQMAQLVDARRSLTGEFENLANRIFEEKNKTFTTASGVSLDALLKPFREQIEGFQKRINEVHDASLRGQTDLGAEIRKVLDIGLKMSLEANNLTSALKGEAQQRGAWGEAQLRRTLEMSGLIEDAHYEAQSSFRDAEGKQKQTDYLIKLPDKKHIIIDSKVSLVAYDRAVSAATQEEVQIALGEHIKAVRKHIDDLAAKDYTNLVGMRSPSFVLMFMPIEPAYIEALKHNKDLFEYGYKKGVVLVSHTTLIPILRTVSNLWMLERSNAEAREISEKAGEIFNQVCVVAERLSKLGGTLASVSNHYNKTVKALAGQQGLYGKVERFGQLSSKVTKHLPQVEPVHMDFESERLALIVEPIEDEEPAPPAHDGAAETASPSFSDNEN